MTTVTVTLVPDGCGLEFDASSGTVYSIGNQNVDVTINPTSDMDCGTFTALINGNAPPVEVCDAEVITVTLTPSELSCTCNQTDVDCDTGTPLFLRTAVQPDGKMRVWLEQNEQLHKMKKLKAIQLLKKRLIERQIKEKLKQDGLL